MQLKKVLLVTFLFSLMFALAAYLVCLKFLSTYRYLNELKLVITSGYMWVPGICALVALRQEGMKLNIVKKPTSYGWHALWIPLVVVALGILFTFPFGTFSTKGVLEAARLYRLHFSHPIMNIIAFIVCLYVVAVVASLTVNFIFALGEELFWRGYLWEKIKNLGFWKASFVIGFLWGLWHAPVIMLFGHNYPEHPMLGIGWMCVVCTLMTPILIYLRVKDNSIMTPTILHGLLNAFCPISVVFFPEVHELLRAPLGIAGILALLVVNGYLLRQKIQDKLLLKPLRQ